MKWFNKEMGSMKSMLAEILKAVGAQAPPPPAPLADQNFDADTSRPSGPSVPVSGPSGPAPAATTAEAEVNEQEPSGPTKHVEGSPGPAEKVSGPSGPLESDPVQTVVEEEVLAPKPPAPSFSSQTHVPPSPPSASTAPPAAQTFKKPQPRPISSPTPFPSQSTFSPISSTHIPPPPSILEFLACASFGKVSFYKHSLDKDPYIDFLEAQLVLHLKRMAPSMGPNYSVGTGPFKTYFERQEEQAWEIISHFASLLSPAYYLHNS
ncbi:hypothetical protein Taro_014895 [Colocasia esculenta]|uniref:Uncharacterized protein n=1 Tax=Colocasia esculenta TaxID=4460 RepID=A0A843UJG2_COLES|nr:hypothetical protein [Colocasia esculenta]